MRKPSHSTASVSGNVALAKKKVVETLVVL